MKRQSNPLGLLLTAGVLAVTAMFTVGAAEMRSTDGIDDVLDNFNLAASEADFDAYFACFAPNAVYIGTDLDERRTVDELRAFAKPYFDRDEGRSHRPRDRHVTMCPGGVAAAFDELVEIDGYGTCRGTGVLVNLKGTWLIKQYSLSVPVPNGIFYDIVDRIRAYREGGDAIPAETNAAVRAALDAYVAAVKFPRPGPVDGGLFAGDIDAIWSDGEVLRGREAVVSALRLAQREIAAEFTTCAAHIEDATIRHLDHVAWVTCHIVTNGELKDDRGTVERVVRSTFVFEFDGTRWRMVQEHSSEEGVDREPS